MRYQTVEDMRQNFKHELRMGRIVLGKTPDGDTIEILGATFLADKRAIFGKVNEGYVDREIAWYMSQSLSVTNMTPPIPVIWKQVSGENGEINSNYGWCIFSEENGHQFAECVDELVCNPYSRRATMIYQRPSMHHDWNRLGMSDFICTNTVQCSIREGTEGRAVLQYAVNMRSNDAVFGYKNDLAWHLAICRKVAGALRERQPGLYQDLQVADIIWHADSLHVYRRHFDLVAGD